MINQFLKMGGVSSVNDFYKKFPTQQHFEHHMRNGGMYAYAGGGDTKLSVIDYLNSKGVGSDMASRKKLAESMGIKNYTGSADQNIEMVGRLNANQYSPEKQAAQNKFVVARPNVPVAGPTLQQPFGNYNMPVSTTKINTPQPKTAKAAAKQKIEEANTAASTNNFQRYPGRGTSFELDYNTYEGRPDQPSSKGVPSKKVTAPKPTNIEGTKADARYLESGMITDKNKGVMHIVKNGKVIKTVPVLTGANKDANINMYDATYLANHPEARGTPTGTYLSTPNPNLYGKPGFNMDPISAFGEPAPQAINLATHTVIGNGPKGGHNYDPAEYKRRMNLMKGPGEKRTGSWGCTNVQGEDIDCLTGQLFPKGDTTIVVDSRLPKDQAFLKKKYGVQKMGGEPCYNCGGMYNYGGPTHQNDTYSAGVSYGTGGTYIPNPAESAYGLPEFMYGYGGDSPDGRAIVNRGPYEGRALVNAFANGGVQNLHDAGYNLDYLAQGGPTFSDVTLYPHQAYVPAFDWMAYGGPTYSNVTQYNHQQYVPAFDWMQDGGMNSGMMMRDNQYAQGGLVKGSVHDVSEEDVQHLINQGYKIQYL